MLYPAALSLKFFTSLLSYGLFTPTSVHMCTGIVFTMVKISEDQTLFAISMPQLVVFIRITNVFASVKRSIYRNKRNRDLKICVGGSQVFTGSQIRCRRDQKLNSLCVITLSEDGIRSCLYTDLKERSKFLGSLPSLKMWHEGHIQYCLETWDNDVALDCNCVFYRND